MIRFDFLLKNEESSHTPARLMAKTVGGSSGIGTDNIDILVNELDAAVNIDLKTRTIKEEKRKLNIVRIGTSGALQKDIEVDSFVVSKYGLGFDGLLNYYLDGAKIYEKELCESFIKQTNWNDKLPLPLFDKRFRRVNK